MTIADKININTHYTRSVNLERDVDSTGVVKSYIPTNRAISTLARISETFNKDGMPRAWAFVGPYGSGKSSFAVFLAHLLGNPNDKINKTANSILKNAESDLSKRFSKEVRGSSGYCAVLLTGSPEPLANRFTVSLSEAADTFWEKQRGTKPKILSKLQKLARKKEPTVSEIIEHVAALQESIKSKGKGVLVVFDELGKFLEYEARHYGANDIYLLQALAEHAFAGNEANLNVIVLLHQAFDQYAKGLGDELKSEWAKVQGRFENIAFLESAEQVLRVVAAAFDSELEAKELKKINSFSREVARVLKNQQALPGTANISSIADVFSSCYPLHPVSALLLPMLCQKVAQNERTLFSYLGSHESSGFKDSLDRLNRVGDWIHPWEIYDYFILNQPAAISDHVTHRRWAEVVIAIERLGDAPKEQIQILKIIGLLNIIGTHGGLKASKELIKLCVPEKFNVTSAIQALVEKSIVQFRKFSGEYRVWQGSDFDLEAAVRDEVDQLGGKIELATELNKRKNLSPIVARKYTIETGALRYFQPIFVDSQSYQRQASISETPRIIFYLSESQDNQRQFKQDVVPYYSDLDIVVLCHNGALLRKAVSEVIALQRVSINRQELNSDPVALREYQDRLAAVEIAENVLLDGLIEFPEDNEWYWRSKNSSITHKRALQSTLSDILKKVFDKAPIVNNELINRDNPSAQAVAARNKLLFAMLHHESDADLAIEKYPPEKAIYRSLLKQSGLHKQNDNGEWCFSEPSKRSSFYQVWKRIKEFLDSTEKEAKSFADLNKELMAPPYGVKAGVLPILYVTVYLVYQHELALYENRRYRPYFSEELLERFVKRPDEFTFQRFRIEGLKASIFKQYSKVLHKDEKQRTLLELAKPLASFMGDLPEYTQKTKQDLSKEAIAVRSAFNLAKSPEVLLFEELPKAVGFGGLNQCATEDQLEDFSKVLTDALRELDNAYSNMLDRQRVLLAQAFNIDNKLPLDELRKVISGYCYGLENFTVDLQGLRAFIMRLTKKTGSDKDWFENIIMFLGHKSPAKWLNSDQDKAEYRLSDFSRKVLDLETLRLHEKRFSNKMSGDFDVYLLRSIKKGEDFQDEVVAVDQQSAKHIESAKENIKETLDNLANNELKLAALAGIVDEFLTDYKLAQSKTSKVKQSRIHKSEKNRNVGNRL